MAAVMVSKGRWNPCERIGFGLAKGSFSPLTFQRIGSGDGVEEEEELVHPHQVPLEVGDEIYVVEVFQPRSRQPSKSSQTADVGVWFRGYVVSTSLQPQLSSSFDSPLATSAPIPPEQPQVSFGVFPASHVHVREQLEDVDGRIAEVASQADIAEREMKRPRSRGPSRTAMNARMEPLHEEDEEEEEAEEEDPSSARRVSVTIAPQGSPSKSRNRVSIGSIASFGTTFSPDQQIQPSRLFSQRPASEVIETRPNPPLPNLKCGDETIHGTEEPLIDEIACALREWASLLNTHFYQRNYSLFSTIQENFDALHSGRRRLLGKKLNSEEVGLLKKELVARLVQGNLKQGLDVIVRHPSTGVLCDAGVEGENGSQGWLSLVRLYATQVALAYNAPTPPLNHSRPSIAASNQSLLPDKPDSSSPFSSSSLSPSTTRFHHVLVDFKHLSATLASPGELVELYFSLFNQSDARYVTEEFCLVLDHTGAPDRPESTSRLKTLFQDLSQHDIQDQLYLICRIVKNGGIKLASTLVAQTPPMSQRNTFSSASPGPRSETASIPEASSFVSKGETENLRDDVTQLEMLVTDGNGRTSCRRPFGCAVLEISQFNRPSQELSDPSSISLVEHRMPIFVPVNEASISTLHEDIIASRIKEIEKSPRADHLSVTVRILHGEVDELTRSLPQSLSDIVITNRLGFPDVVFPDDRRNEVFIKLWSGEFGNTGSSTGTTRSLAQLASTSSAKNVEITVELRRKDGKPLDRVLSRGSGEKQVTQFTSMVFRSNNNPTWGELVKVDVPLEEAENCHLYFTFRSRSLSPSSSTHSTGPPFAFAYFPLFTNSSQSAFQPDGSHNLVLYRWDRSVSVPAFYLQGPPTQDSSRSLPPLPPAVSHTLVPLQDTFIIRSYLVSTYHTQNETLLKLLRWKTDLSQDPTLATEILTQLTFCSEVETCKFLRDIFDALFGILASEANADGQLSETVFHAVVTILGFVSDRRFTNFKPVLELYIAQHFVESTAGSYILHSLQRLLRQPANPETAPLLRSSIKVWRWLFKFVERSHEMQKSEGGKPSNDLDSPFLDEISSILSSLGSLMRTTSPSSIIGTQTLAVQHFASILPSLSHFFDSESLAETVASFVDSIGAPKGKMMIWRLLLLNQVITSPTFSSPASRSLLLPNIVRWIKPSLGKFEEHLHFKRKDPQTTRDNARVSWIEALRLSIGVVAVLLDTVQEALVDPTVNKNRSLLAQEHDNLEYLLGLLPRLVESYREMQNFANLEAVERQRSQASVASTSPNVFPSTYPLSLLSYTASQARRLDAGSNETQGEEQSETWPTLQAGVGEVAAIFITLVLLSPRKIFVNWLESTLEIEGKDTFARQLGQMFRVAQSIVEEEAFPSDWLNVTALAHRAVMQVIESVTDILVSDFLPPPSSSFSFNTALWKDFFGMLLKLVASPQLLIENFSPQKRRAVWRLTGDIRAEGSKVLSRTWNAIAAPQDRKPLRYGLYQVQFVPNFLEDVLTLCLSQHDELRRTGIEMLYSMILGEYHLNSPPQFIAIEKEVIDRFDRLFGVDTKGDELSRASFVDQLRQLFDESDIEEDLRTQVDSFLSSINSFLDLLLAVRSLPEGEEYQEDRIIATLKLMSFIRGIGRSEIFIRYVQRLVTYHVALGNETEAGLTLKLHADLHEWDLSKSVDASPDLDLPRQTEFARKETLYMRILDHLGRGKAWETALAFSRELQHEYETNAFNYARLAELLNLQAELYASIAHSDRQFGNYYRVAFYGQWPASVSNKQFVYRGQPLETLGGFIDRMLSKHPNAHYLDSNSLPNEDIQFSESQYLQITSITPELDRSSPIFTNQNIPHYVRNYYERNDINTFSFTSPLATNDSTANDASSNWTEKTVLICEESFPTILRRSEIVEIRLIEISPIENALQDVETSRDALSSLLRRYTALSENEEDPRSIDSNALSMNLNEAVDPPSDRGVPHYRRIFLDPAFVATLPSSQLPIIRQLESAIDELVVTLARCLKLHANLCPSEMQPFHETLERFFEKSFSEEISRLPPNTYEPAIFEELAVSTTETSLDLPRESTTQNGLLISTRDSFSPTPVDRSRLGSISGASLNGGGIRRTTSVRSERPQSPTKSLVSTRSAAMTANGSGKENGTSSSSSLFKSAPNGGTEERSSTPTNNGAGGGKRTSIFGNFGKKKNLGKRKGSVSVLAEED